MAFYPTEGIKGPNGNYINCYLIETCLFLLFKIDGYIWPNFDYLTINYIYWRDFLLIRFPSK